MNFIIIESSLGVCVGVVVWVGVGVRVGGDGAGSDVERLQLHTRLWGA